MPPSGKTRVRIYPNKKAAAKPLFLYPLRRLTCTDNQSRNRRFGMMLGQGMDVQSAQDKIGQVVEGYRNTKEVRELAHRFGVEMPITEEIYQVLYCGKNAREAALTLLGRARKDERSRH